MSKFFCTFAHSSCAKPTQKEVNKAIKEIYEI